MRRVVVAWGVGLAGLTILGTGVRATLASAREGESRQLLGRIEALKAQELEVREKLAAARAERERARADLERAWSAYLAELRQHEPIVPKGRSRGRWERGTQPHHWWENQVADATTTLECLRVGYEFAAQPPKDALEMPEPEDHGLVWEE